MTKQVYLAGGIMTKGEQMQRAAEAADIRAIGLELYSPQENKEINDKANLDNNEGLAEKIVKADTDKIVNADIIVIEPQPFALGTMAELGQIKGMKDFAKMVIEIYEDDETYPDNEDALAEILHIAERIENQKVYPHYQDIRRFDGVTESGDRRSLGINQYIYGLVLSVTNGHGFYEWDEILDELRPKGESK